MNQTESMQLTERLADRLCHDVASSAQAVASGLDLLAEARSEAEREEALAFLAEALAAQRFKLSYARRAYGSAARSVDVDEVKSLAEGLFDGQRPTLDWRIGSLGFVAARTVLILLQIAADCIAAGGVARAETRVEAGRTTVTVEAEGPRASVRDEVRAGLSGAPFDAGVAGRWVQGAFLSALATSAGGAVIVEKREGAVRFAVSLPPEA